MFRFLVLSDIHLGHNKTPTEFITHNLRIWFKDYEHLFNINNLDAIFISGDVFDRLLSPNSIESMEAYTWLSELAKYCSENNIKLRILEGTPSHDWKQTKLLYKIIGNLHLDIDFKYYEDVDIEVIRTDNAEVSVLYIPDEIRETSEETYELVKSTLKKHNMEKVDIVIMHGAFNYQLPVKGLDFLHNEDDYLSITNDLVIVGHIHNQSIFKNNKYKSFILCPGSFDRLTFADEDIKKGGWLVEINEDGVNTMFLENRLAINFKTIDISDKNINSYKKIIESIPKYSNIRLIVNEENNVNELVKYVKSVRPDINIVVKVNKTKNNNENKVENVSHTFKITEDNIRELIYEELKNDNYDKELLNEELDLILSSL